MSVVAALSSTDHGCANASFPALGSQSCTSSAARHKSSSRTWQVPGASSQHTSWAEKQTRSHLSPRHLLNHLPDLVRDFFVGRPIHPSGEYGDRRGLLWCQRPHTNLMRLGSICRPVLLPTCFSTASRATVVGWLVSRLPSMRACGKWPHLYRDNRDCPRGAPCRVMCS